MKTADTVQGKTANCWASSLGSQPHVTQVQTAAQLKY